MSWRDGKRRQGPSHGVIVKRRLECRLTDRRHNKPSYTRQQKHGRRRANDQGRPALQMLAGNIRIYISTAGPCLTRAASYRRHLRSTNHGGTIRFSLSSMTNAPPIRHLRRTGGVDDRGQGARSCSCAREGVGVRLNDRGHGGLVLEARMADIWIF